MKRIAPFLVFVTLTAAAFAYSVNPKGNLSSLINILPGKATQEEVKKMLGGPTVVNINNKTGKEVWQYETTVYSGVLDWNHTTGSLEQCSYTAHKAPAGKWGPASAARLITGATSAAQAEKVLGTPHDIQTGMDEQRLRYTYDDNVVVLEFKQGVLFRYVVEKKKVS